MNNKNNLTQALLNLFFFSFFFNLLVKGDIDRSLYHHVCELMWDLMQLGGPTWNVKLGRRDARTASRSAANANIPPPTSNLNRLISSFSSKGLSVKDMVALAGTCSLPNITQIFNDSLTYTNIL